MWYLTFLALMIFKGYPHSLAINTHSMTHSSALLFFAFLFRLRTVRPNREGGYGTMSTWVACIAIAVPSAVSLVSLFELKTDISNGVHIDDVKLRR